MPFPAFGNANVYPVCWRYAIGFLLLPLHGLTVKRLPLASEETLDLEAVLRL